MPRSMVFAATAVLLTITNQPGIAQEALLLVSQPPSPEVIRVQVKAGSVYEVRDLNSSRLNADDLVWVTSIPSSGIVDPPSYEAQ